MMIYENRPTKMKFFLCVKEFFHESMVSHKNDINQPEHGGDKRPPDFQISSKNYFTSIPSDKSIGSENPRS